MSGPLLVTVCPVGNHYGQDARGQRAGGPTSRTVTTRRPPGRSPGVLNATCTIGSSTRPQRRRPGAAAFTDTMRCGSIRWPSCARCGTPTTSPAASSTARSSPSARCAIAVAMRTIRTRCFGRGADRTHGWQTLILVRDPVGLLAAGRRSTGRFGCRTGRAQPALMRDVLAPWADHRRCPGSRDWDRPDVLPVECAHQVSTRIRTEVPTSRSALRGPRPSIRCSSSRRVPMVRPRRVRRCPATGA